MRFLSLFSGIEAASAAWLPLGWTCVGVSEIEPGPCILLRYRHPGTPNLGDITKITEDQIKALGRIDLVVFGSPCQDLSVAGKRKGFTNADGDFTRSGLFFAAMRIIGWARKHCGLRFAVWENVPGAFSSNAGADFAAVVGHLAGMEPAVPPKGWGTEGAAVGTEAMVEWSTLDAQWFGVAQRRRRVFAVADFGDWTSRPPILLEPEGLRGDSAPRRQTGQDTTAGTLRSTDGGCDVDHIRANHAVAVTLRGRDGGGTAELGGPISNALRASGGGGDKQHVLIGLQRPVLSFGGNNTSGPIDVATALNACGTATGRLDFESETFVLQRAVVSSLDASYHRLQGCSGQDMNHGHSHLVPTFAIQAGALRTNPLAGHDGVGVQEHIAYTLEARAEVQAVCLPFDTTQITSKQNRSNPAYGDAQPDEMRFDPNVSASLTCSQKAGAQVGMQVRRLTPRECERLQGFPDDHTLVPVKKAKRRSKAYQYAEIDGQLWQLAADGPRYKALGNSMAVPVMAWIGRSIEYAMLFDVAPAPVAPGPCAKQTVTATIIALDGTRHVGTNYCRNPQATCPRGDMPSGTGYHLCTEICQQVGHAETVAIDAAGRNAVGATLYLEGHTYACDACQGAARAAGISEIVIGAPPADDLFGGVA